MAEKRLTIPTAVKGYNALRTTLVLIQQKGQVNRLPRAFSTYAEAKTKMCQDSDINEWLDVVQIPAPVVIALAFVMKRPHREQVTHAIHLLMKLLLRVSDLEESKLPVADFVEKGSRFSKMMERSARNDGEMETLKLLCTFECAIRIEEFWDTLRSQYSGTNNMINKTITVQELREKIAKTSVVDLGSLYQSHPPYGSHCQQIRLRTKFAPLTREYWDQWTFDRMAADTQCSQEVMEKRVRLLRDILKEEAIGMAYAMRRHNARTGHNTSGMIILQNVLEDWTSMRYDLPLERTAAVVHAQAVLMTSSMLHKWKGKLANYPGLRELYNHVRFELRDVKMALDLREDIWEVGGYNVASADQGLYEAIEMRNRTFSCIHDFITTTSASQVAQGAAEVTHIPRWDEPLQPKDGRNPPAHAVPPSWDPQPIVMMNAKQMAAEEERRRKEAASQPQPEAKARPTSPGGGASESTGSAGASAKPPPKSRPTQPPTPPDWVIAKVPSGYLFKTSTNPDHRGSLFMTSAWMNDLDQFLLSIMQGPAASASSVTGWAQYLRRVSAYGCMIFGVFNPAVVTDDDAAKISEADG